MFQEARDKNEVAQYAIRAERDGGASLARDAGEDIDTSWAAKLADKPPLNSGAALAPEIVIGAEVRPAHPRPSGATVVEMGRALLGVLRVIVCLLLLPSLSCSEKA